MAKYTTLDMGWSQTPGLFIRNLIGFFGELETTCRQVKSDHERVIDVLIWLSWRMSLSTYNEALDPGRATKALHDKAFELDRNARILVSNPPSEGPRTAYRIRVLVVIAYIAKCLGRYENADLIFANIPDTKTLIELLEAENFDLWLKQKRKEREHFLNGGPQAARALAECFKDPNHVNWVELFGLKCLLID